jgi:hypothetical protein
MNETRKTLYDIATIMAQKDQSFSKDEIPVSKMSTTGGSCIENITNLNSCLTADNHNEHFLFEKLSTDWSKSALNRASKRSNSLMDVSLITDNTQR